jgi:hypothetical protein
VRIPPEAFAFYLALGAARSYQAVADHYGATKNGVLARALRDDWPKKLTAAEVKVVARAESKAVESLAVMHERHLAQIRAVQIVAVQTLQAHPTMATAMEAARAIQMMITTERLVRGEATERTEATTIGDLARMAYDEEQAALRAETSPTGLPAEDVERALAKRLPAADGEDQGQGNGQDQEREEHAPRVGLGG